MPNLLAGTWTLWSSFRIKLLLVWTRLRPFMSGAIGALIMLLLVNVLNPPPAPLTTRDVKNTIAEAMASATPRPSVASQVYEIIRPSLVVISTNLSAGPDEQAVNFAPDLEDTDLHYVQDSGEGVSTGVIVNDAGVILTSLHAVASAPSINVTFADGTQSSATIVSTLSEDDVAVLQADVLPAQFVPAVLGNPGASRVGDEAYIVGHPFGLQGSMTAGVISGFGRTYQLPSGESMQNLIQVDAATNPGASGGPLLNRSGQVIGIVTMLLNPTGQDVFIGIGFAVPITTAAGGAGLLPR